MTKTINLEIVVPDWVDWIAQDAEGAQHGFEKEPQPTKFLNTEYWSGPGISTKLCQGLPNPNWKETLQYVGSEE